MQLAATLEKYLNDVITLGNKYKTYNPFILAEEMGIEIQYVDFGKKPLGQATSINGDRMILLDESLRYEEVRYFVAAHELCHSVNHDGLGGYYTSHSYAKSKIEKEADSFSIVLLLYLYEEMFGDRPKQISDVSYAFGLSDERIESFF